MASLGVITWSCQAFYYLFTQQEFPEKRIRFFEDRVLDRGDATLGDLGLLHGQLALCLGVACIVVFVFVAAGTKSLGKVWLNRYKLISAKIKYKPQIISKQELT